ncbi:zinc finger protein 37-like isoform X2 [Aricia agestis]|uniref:zinc finger protein 37-like isoform X2 n=1 Tax=Aricia agestis TaxID=91739 RepID=UPI001C202B40|nr:zinc finger protein 37-like isoform X2 [Aricia agestis]
MEVFLYNSTVCRLCGEENDNGTFLYSSEENNQNLCKTINTYLPIKVSDDGQLPRTICPGCTIQLEATVEFLNLIINGQKVIRKLYQREKEYKRSIAKGAKESDVDADNIIYEINTTDGVYLVDHPASLHIAGLEKPKRKRGRPPKSAKSQEETTTQKPEESVKEVKEQQNEEEPSGKRRRKTPTRYKEAVQGPELERILIEEGVIDADEKTVSKAEAVRVPKTPAPPKEPQVIGHLEISGEPIVVMRSRGRPKGPSRQKIEECPICDMKFTSVGRYMSHVARHGPVQFKCGCDTVFATRQSFCEHQKETGHTGRTVVPCVPKEENEETNAKTEIKDETVSQDSTSQTSTDQTMTIVDSAETMQELNETPTVTENELEGEIVEIQEEEINVEGDYVITTSEENNEVNMDSTIETKTETETEENGRHKFKCQFCPKLYNSKQSKSLHMKAVHMGERGHVCGECGARFAYPRSLALHKISHRRARNRGFACDLCGKVLNHPSSVVYHKQSEHAAQRFVCGKCGKCFRHKQLLQRHQLVHSEARPYACKICNSRFKTKPNLLNHQLLHSGIKKFSCQICKVKFAHKTSLTLHMRWHTGQKPFVCGVCGKSFSQKGNLSEHERIHTGEKPFACSLCPRRFTTSSQHRLHMRRHELTQQQNLRIQVENPEQEVVIESPQKQLNASNKVKKPISLLVNESQIREDESEQVIYVAYESADGLPSFRVINEESVEIEEQPQAADLYSGSSLLVPSQLQALQTDSETIYLDNQQLINSEDLQMQQMEIENGEIENEQLELDNVQLELETEDLVLEDNIMEEKVSADHIRDARGQGLQFTMQDGTRLALASIDGGAIQVITHDGQTIPVEINGYNEEEESHSENILQHLNVVKSEDSDNVTYFIRNVSNTWKK